MNLATGSGNGLIGGGERDRYVRAVLAIPIATMQAAAAAKVGAAAASKLTRGQMFEVIGDRAINDMIGCCPSACSALGDAASDGPDPSLVVTIEKAPPKLPPDGFPASPPFRPGNWKFDENKYMIAPGDTLSGLARLYLGGPTRWPEIWAPNKFSFASPDKIPANTFIVMPEEATKAAQFLLKSKQVPATPASPGAPGSVPGAVDPAQPDKPAAAPATPKWLPWAAGGVGVVAIGGVLYAVLK